MNRIKVLNRTINKIGYFTNIRNLSENAAQEMHQGETVNKRPHIPVMLNEVVEHLVTSNSTQVWCFHFLKFKMIS